MNVKCKDGSRFNGILAIGQVWINGKQEREIWGFNKHHMFYLTKKDKEEGTVTCTSRSVFRRWLFSKDGAVLQNPKVGELNNVTLGI